jgi:hypothetical protein
VYVTDAVRVTVADGALKEILGAVLSTTNVELVAAGATLPALSLAIPVGTVIPGVPSPLIVEIVTV